MKPQPGVRLTIISREVESPYSGMLPGHVAGFYEHGDMHIDLGRLALFAGARWITDAVEHIDLESREVHSASHPPLRFDLLSINSGGVPVGVSEFVIPVKPIGRFLPQWHAVRETLRPGQRIVIVGGGAGGVELALAMRASVGESIPITIVCTMLMPAFYGGVADLVRESAAQRGVEILEDFRVVSATAAAVSASDGRTVDAEHVFWVTGVSAPEFPARSGLETDPQGFVIVDEHLRSVSHPHVFAAGDVACLADQPRPKSGVFAVREGPVLARNLQRALTGRRLLRYRAQQEFLTLIGTGDRRAIACRGDRAGSGRWAWWWKDWIDRRFMRRFNRLPEMAEPRSTLPRALAADAPDPMRCGGCGAKLGASPLLRVLAKLPPQTFSQVALGIGDDAALIRGDGDVILTVDGFPSLVSDPYLFGRITAHHSLNDVLAMGGRGVSALALATVPVMAEAMMEDDLYQMLRGAVDVLNEHDVPLVGGHSAEGAELSLALTVTGTLDGAAPLAKSQLAVGQVLVLTKALGTGALLAAHMRGRLPGPELQSTLASLDQSNAAAAAVLMRAGATALTDVSGFGFAGHLSEMLRASGVGATVSLAALPALPGALRVLAAEISSSLQGNNLQALSDFQIDTAADSARVQLLADPQTSGGLLAGVPASAAAACVAALHEAGYAHAAIVGTVSDGDWRVVNRD